VLHLGLLVANNELSSVNVVLYMYGGKQESPRNMILDMLPSGMENLVSFVNV